MDMHDLRHFFFDRANKRSQLYFLAGSMGYSFSKIALPVAAIIFLGSEKHVGIFNASFAVLSAFMVMFFSKKRHPKNRLQFLFYTSMIAGCATFFFALFFHLYVFIVYSLALLLLVPLLRISAHVIDLETMDALPREGKDFYSTMVLRDVALWFWRIVSLLTLAVIILIFGDGETAVRIALFGYALAHILGYIGASRLTQRSMI